MEGGLIKAGQRVLRVLPVLLAVLAGMPAIAAAAPYTAVQEICGGGDAERGSGQVDGAGNLYLPCSFDGPVGGPVVARTHIKIFGAGGALVRTVPIAFPADGRSAYVGDVAPSPDGAYLYVVRHATHTYHRLNRQLDGSYVLDPTWRLANYLLWGAAYRPDGEFIATDGLGNIYVTTGTWTGSPTNVAKYRPDGTLVTNFGDWQKSRAVGTFYWMLGGLAVTRDGRSIYTVEVGNNRVQRFDQRVDGTYAAALQFGNTAADDGPDNPNTAADESRIGYCYVPGKFAAPYDVALDAGGDVYVVNTTCFANRLVEVQRFTRDGAFKESITGTSFQWTRVHGLAIDGLGNIHLPQAGLLLRAPVPGPAPPAPVPPAPEPVPPPPDPVPAVNQAPVLRDFQLPAATTTQLVTITVDATDDVAVTQLRSATEAGIWSAWVPFTTPIQVSLSPYVGIARKGLSIQVRDAQGRESGVLYRMTNYQPAAPAPAPEPAPVPAPEPDPVPVPAPEPAPVPEPPAGPNVAPTVRAVRMPNPTATQLVPVTVDATDDRGIAQMRIANENGTWTAWRAWSADSMHLLTPGAMMKGITVEVRDADGATARSAFTKTLCTPCTPPVMVAAALRVTAPVTFFTRARRPVLVVATVRADTIRLPGRRDQHLDASHRDRRRDRIDCGPGYDTVLKRREDRTRNCELVRTVRAPR